MGNKKATGFLCLRLVPCFAYVGAEDNRKGIPFVKIVSLLCKLIQFLMVALSVTVHKALILLVFLNHPYQSLAFSRFFMLCCVDEKDALPADHVTPNRRPVGRISGKTGLLAGGAYAPQIRFVPQNELRRGGFADPEH